MFFEPVRHLWARQKPASIQADDMTLATDLLTSIQVRNLSLDWVKPKALDMLLSDAKAKHRLDGTALPTDPPVLLFRVASSEDAGVLRRLGDPSLGRSPIGLVVWPWESPFGSLLTITTMGKIPGVSHPANGPMPIRGPYPRVCLPSNDPTFGKLKAGTFTGIFVYGKEPVAAIEVTFSAQRSEYNPLHRAFTALSSHEPVLDDPRAAYWEVLGALSIYEKHLTPEDRLSLGWIHEYRRWALALSGYLTAVQRELDLKKAQLTELTSHTTNLLNLLRDSGCRPEPLLELLSKLDAEGGSKLWRACESASAELRKWTGSAGVSDELADLPFFALNTYLMSSSRTHEGGVVPWLKDDGKLRSLELLPDQFPESCPPEEYWKRIGVGHRLNLGICVSGYEAPARLLTDDDWKKIGTEEAVSVPDPEREANRILEGLARAGIPDIRVKTPVRVRLGQFGRGEATRIGQDVFFVLRNTDDEFVYVCVEPDTRYCELIVPSPVDLTGRRRQVLSVMKLQLAKALLEL